MEGWNNLGVARDDDSRGYVLKMDMNFKINEKA
jgi:hypothetical protein